MCKIKHQAVCDLQHIDNDAQNLYSMICKFRFLGWIVFSLLAMASSASAASTGSTMIAKYISKVRADLRRQRPETRESWLRAEMDSMNYKTSHLGIPSVKDCCKYLNLAVSDKKEILVQNLAEKLMSEIGHVTESASAFSGSSVVKSYVPVLRVGLTQKEPEERWSWLLKELDALLKKERKYGKPSVEA